MIRRDLREKLARQLGSNAPPPPTDGVREWLLRHAERRARRSAVELPPGVEVDTPRGPCWVRRTAYPDGHVHGTQPLGKARAASFAVLASLARDDDLASASLRDCLFLDTETTGLFGGAGTTVFLTGLGFLDGDGFVVEQAFLRSFAEEPAALAHVAARLAERPVLVTFVGKSFDRHRLAARMSVCKVAAPVLAARHLDLYHLARRAWRHELPDVRLSTVERERLGLNRDRDLPGRDAPRAFLDWLRDRTGEVDRVLEHNRLDVLSLFALLGLLGRGAPPAAG
jgi:uncharacterized protein YprB with RNaseH-like and TPR domain